MLVLSDLASVFDRIEAKLLCVKALKDVVMK